MQRIFFFYIASWNRGAMIDDVSMQRQQAVAHLRITNEANEREETVER